MLTKKELGILDKIDFYNRYKSLSEEHRIENRLEKQEIQKVLDIFQDLGYSAKFNKSERFYKILEKSEICEFYCHFSLKYGLVEIILGGTDLASDVHLGDVAAGLCKDMEIAKNDITDGYIRDPGFTSYEELENILIKALALYEDFKIEFKASML